MHSPPAVDAAAAAAPFDLGSWHATEVPEAAGWGAQPSPTGLSGQGAEGLVFGSHLPLFQDPTPLQSQERVLNWETVPAADSSVGSVPSFGDFGRAAEPAAAAFRAPYAPFAHASARATSGATFGGGHAEGHAQQAQQAWQAQQPEPAEPQSQAWPEQQAAWGGAGSSTLFGGWEAPAPAAAQTAWQGAGGLGASGAPAQGSSIAPAAGGMPEIGFGSFLPEDSQVGLQEYI